MVPRVRLPPQLRALGADSLDVVEMVMKIEEEFNVELPDERAEEVQNLSDAAPGLFWVSLWDAFKSKMAAASAAARQ